jgi:putative transposase
VLNAWPFNAISEVQAAADEWLVDYNECRPHESLGDVPPVLFKPRAFNEEVTTTELST